MTQRSIIFALDFDCVMRPGDSGTESKFCRLDLLKAWLRGRPSVGVLISSSWREVHALDELVAVRLVKATNAALDQIELDSGIGSPVLGKRLGIPGLRTWEVAKFPMLWFYFERGDHLDVVIDQSSPRSLPTVTTS